MENIHFLFCIIPDVHFLSIFIMVNLEMCRVMPMWVRSRVIALTIQC